MHPSHLRSSGSTMTSTLTLAAMTTFLLGLVQLPKTTDAAVALELVPANPDYPGQCYLEQTGDAFALGTSMTLPDHSCTMVTCYESETDGQFLVMYTSCAVAGNEWGACTLTPPEGVPYPTCCQYECPEGPKELPPSKDIFLSKFGKTLKAGKFGQVKASRPKKLQLYPPYL